MRAIQLTLPAFAVLVNCCCGPSVAAGQTSDRGPRVGGILSSSFGNGGTTLATGLSGGYRFTSALGLELEGLYQTKLDFGDFPNCPPDAICAAVRGGTFSLHGRIASLSSNVVAQVPVQASWIRPYLVAGGGVAHVRREQRDNFLPYRSTATSTDPLLTLGGGVDFPVGRRVALGIDMRYQRIFGERLFGRSDIEPNLNLTRLGGSVSYRF